MELNEKFDLIVIGAGAAGIVSSTFAAGLGLRVALIADGHPGGECLWTGCVPSKALVHCANLHQILRNAKVLDKAPEEYSFKRAMEYMKESRQKISHHDSIETLEKNNVHAIEGRARFVSSNTVQVGNKIITARKFIIATGASPSIPDIQGLKESGFLTHETILELEERPNHLCIIGGGPVGVEYAQVMLRLGSKVSIVHAHDRLLPKEEPQTSEFIAQILRNEGANVYLDQQILAVSGTTGNITLTLKGLDGVSEVKCDHLLVAIGKTPNARNLGLEHTAVRLEDDGKIITDKYQKTTAPNIWACGDVCSRYEFTHYADHQARTAVMNACLRLPVGREEHVIPWCTFTDPEIASVGIRYEEAVKKLGKQKVFLLKYGMDDLDRAILDDRANGFILLTVNAGGNILGASIVGPRAGELIHEIALAMKAGWPITKLAGMIHVYPTMSAAIQNVGTQYYQQVLATSWKSTLLKRFAALIK